MEAASVRSQCDLYEQMKVFLMYGIYPTSCVDWRKKQKFREKVQNFKVMDNVLYRNRCVAFPYTCAYCES